MLGWIFSSVLFLYFLKIIVWTLRKWLFLYYETQLDLLYFRSLFSSFFFCSLFVEVFLLQPLLKCDSCCLHNILSDEQVQIYLYVTSYHSNEQCNNRKYISFVQCFCYYRPILGIKQEKFSNLTQNEIIMREINRNWNKKRRKSCENIWLVDIW